MTDAPDISALDAASALSQASWFHDPQWWAIVAALFLGILNIILTWWNRNQAQNMAEYDRHLGERIDEACRKIEDLYDQFHMFAAQNNTHRIQSATNFSNNYELDKYLAPLSNVLRNADQILKKGNYKTDIWVQDFFVPIERQSIMALASLKNNHRISASAPLHDAWKNVSYHLYKLRKHSARVRKRYKHR